MVSLAQEIHKSNIQKETLYVVSWYLLPVRNEKVRVYVKPPGVEAGAWQSYVCLSCWAGRNI